MTEIKKRAFITGGGSGIGLALAQAFSKNGIDVTIAGRDTARLAKTGLPFLEMDVTNEASVIDVIKAAGPIDIFIANAGAAITAPALKTSREVWDQMIAVNLTSTYLCAREAVPQMVDRGWGRFIAIASTASLKGYAYTGAYAAAKHMVFWAGSKRWRSNWLKPALQPMRFAQGLQTLHSSTMLSTRLSPRLGAHMMKRLKFLQKTIPWGGLSSPKRWQAQPFGSPAKMQPPSMGKRSLSMAEKPYHEWLP